MQLYPAHAAEALEFNKVAQLLKQKCRTDAALERVDQIRFHTRIEYVEKALQQTNEFKSTLGGSDHFPNDFTRNVQRELKLLSVYNAVLSGEQLIAFQQLAINIRDILLWFKRHNELFPNLRALTEKISYEKQIPEIVSSVVDELGNVRDNASKELMQIRGELAKTRQELRRVFDGILRKLAKQGYLADISEGFLNGRRTVAIFAEHKRIVKGILHGESESQKTVFIEPEETIELNNDIFSLERAESREIHKILAETTAKLSAFHPQLDSYYHLCGIFDFIRAKALLAVDMDASMPRISPHPGAQLIKAFHPLLLLHNKQNGKPIVPLNIVLDKQNRVLIISGPNAGGKTVSMKTVGLLQLMTQAGLLIPVDDNSEIGIFKQLMIHIGDTQSIEHELSTYSAHLRDMKYFMDFANGKTLFFIDELGSGSDPNLGGAFAEAIVEELAQKHSFGIITTHYLNLKVMAGKVQGIFNGAMTFDEEKLEPLYRLNIGKPGSSYTFAIAQRSGLSPKIIDRARQITDRGHFKLDKMLLQTEQQSVRLGGKEKELDSLINKNEKLSKEYETLIDKERLKQHYATLKLQNQIKKEELDYLRDMERKFKQIIHDWKKAENKQDVIQAAESVLFKKKAIAANAIAAKKADKNYDVLGGLPKVGDLVRNKVNHQVGTVDEIRDKRAIVKIGQMPFNVNIDEWVVVRRKEQPKTKKGKKKAD
ncbi:endonuclease MutS2 [Taibaiella soli]|uniref:DNA mismatch repair protein MutS n=2 Tax=Taibaiella soli TaxID=1649169 RepID=A0A2W2A6Q4_9BACT|nr:DNA mismatch repair protein MutS [Taibaiella soli]